MTLTRRSDKIGPLTIDEHDENLRHLSDGENIAQALDQVVGGDTWRAPKPSVVVDADDGNAEVAIDGGGIYFRAPNGTRFLLTIDEQGRLLIGGFVIGIPITPEPTVVAPTAAGNLADRDLTQGTGTSTYDTSGDFTDGGGMLVFSLVNPPTGLTIDPETGVVSEDTNALALFGEDAPRIVVVRATNESGSDDSAYSMIVRAPVFSASVVNGKLEFDTGSYQGLFSLRVPAPSIYAGTYSQTVDGVPLHTDLMAGVPVAIIAGVLTLGVDTDGSGTPTEGDTLDYRGAVFLTGTDFTATTRRLFVGTTDHGAFVSGDPVPSSAAEMGVHVRETATNAAGTSAAVESNYLPIEMTPEPQFSIQEVDVLKLNEAVIENGTYTWSVPDMPAGDYYVTTAINADSSRDVLGMTINGASATPVQANGKTAARESAKWTHAQVRGAQGITAGTGTVTLSLSSTSNIFGASEITLYCAKGEHHVLDVSTGLIADAQSGYNFLNEIMTAENGAIIGAFANVANPPNTFAGVSRIPDSNSFRALSTPENPGYEYSMSNSNNLNSSRLVQAAIALAPGAPA